MADVFRSIVVDNQLIVGGRAFLGGTIPAAVSNLTGAAQPVLVGQSVGAVAQDSAANFIGLRFNGPPGVPTAILTGQVVTSVQGRGWDSTQFATVPYLQMSATSNWSPTDTGAQVAVVTIPTGTVLQQTGLIITNSQAADELRLQVRDVSAAILKVVSRGAADSGGVGFRLLRIPN